MDDKFESEREKETCTARLLMENDREEHSESRIHENMGVIEE